MKTKERLELMGQIVTVNRRLSKARSSDTTTWHEYPIEPRAGWVVGFRTLKEGRWRWEVGDREFLQNNTIPCVLVSFWPTMNPIEVPYDGYEMGGEPHAPYAWGQDNPRIYKASTEEMREIMSDWPRDENGRWIKMEKQ